MIDVMMSHLDVGYYVGWLSGAALHGAAHQAVQTFQVAVGRQVRDRVIGRTRFDFAHRDVSAIPWVGHPTRSGSARVSSVAATVLDIAADVGRAGGLDNAVTAIIGLSELENFDLSEVVALAPSFPTAAGRRAGWVLERFAGRRDLAALANVVARATPTPSRLDPHSPASGEVDRTWMLFLNRDVEPDA